MRAVRTSTLLYEHGAFRDADEQWDLIKRFSTERMLGQLPEYCPPGCLLPETYRAIFRELASRSTGQWRILERAENEVFPVEHLEPEDLGSFLESDNQELRLRACLLLGKLAKPLPPPTRGGRAQPRPITPPTGSMPQLPAPPTRKTRGSVAAGRLSRD